MSRLISPSVQAVAITRPQEDAEIMAQGLQAQGIASFIVPMLCIESVRISLPPLLSQPLQAIIATSRHAVKALAGHELVKTLPLCAVGEATAQAAREAGFSHVVTAGGSAASLLEYVLRECRPEAGKLLYARGQDITRDLAGELRAHGFAAEEVILYRAVVTEAFPVDYMQALAQGKVDEVWFFSERSAANYVRLALTAQLQDTHRRMVAVCLSDTIRHAVTGLPWRDTIMDRL